MNGLIKKGHWFQFPESQNIPQEWNKHIWKHWPEWKKEFPWMEVTQTGLGCSVCKSAGVPTNSWSKFRACRNASWQLTFVSDSFFSMLMIVRFC